LPFGTECGSFPAPKSGKFKNLVIIKITRPKQKKRKIGTIFSPKGGLGQVPKGPLAQSAVVYKKDFLRNFDEHG
jgi:hypothetical protein